MQCLKNFTFIYISLKNIELENITQLFSKINEEFYDESSKDYSWYAMLDIERPFYDIDYWRGTHIALQLFFMARENEKDAVNIFEKMIRLL